VSSAASPFTDPRQARGPLYATATRITRRHAAGVVCDLAASLLAARRWFRESAVLAVLHWLIGAHDGRADLGCPAVSWSP
jgi:hypothetical protein